MVPISVTDTMIDSEDTMITQLIDNLAVLCLNQPTASMTANDELDVNMDEQGFEVKLSVCNFLFNRDD
jgi:hypothetical protein